MSFMFVGGGIALTVLLLAYFRPGRFGTTVLALGTGYLLTLIWIDTLAMYEFIRPSFLSWRDAAMIALVTFPGLLALLFSNKQKSLLPRIVAAPAVALLVITLLLPLFIADAESQIMYRMIEDYRELIISGLLVLGLLDMVFARLPKATKHDKH
jgi:hypothetical protein